MKDSFYDQLREMSKRFDVPIVMGRRSEGKSMLHRGLDPEVIVSLERSRQSVERRLNMQIQKERGGFGIVFDEVGDFTADTWNRPLNLKLSLIGLAVKGQFK